VSLPEDATLWFEVQVETLKRVHSSWVPGVPIELLAQARKLALGRRWLARRLTVVSPVLFGLPAELDTESVERLRAAAWLAPLAAEPLQTALDLGALALAPLVRTPANQPEFIRRGATEFAAFADFMHPAWGESVRLTYERDWWFEASHSSLTPAVAEACLRPGVAERHNDHVSPDRLNIPPHGSGRTTHSPARVGPGR
jgi:hypothetical protein